MSDLPWRVWIDTGGTFTDCIAVRDQEVRRCKVLSSGRLVARVRDAEDRQVEIEPIQGCVPGFLEGFQVSAGAGGHRNPDKVASDDEAVDDDNQEQRPRINVVRHIEALDGAHRLELSARWHGGSSVELWSGLEAPIVGLHLLLGLRPSEPLPPHELRLGTTRGTNALLERRGARCALFVTKGFADLLEIGDQSRPDIFAREIKKPKPLPEVVLEVDERISATGEVLVGVESLTPGTDVVTKEPWRSWFEILQQHRIDSVAVSLLHGYLKPRHEQVVGSALRTQGLEVSLGSDLSGLAGYLARTQTAVVDAYLAPILRGYIQRIDQHIRQPLRIMSSAGGLVSADRFKAKDSLLSGPAGGVMGCLDACRLAGVGESLAFDMGGTSTDVSRIGDDVEYDESHRVGGIVVVAPALAIRTVAAGGGSLCVADGGRLRVGPESAGALPGPACYGRGGPLTVTDVNLLLGRIDGERFEVGLDVEASRRALVAQRSKVAGITETDLLEGFLQIGNERMAETIREVSTRQGFDPKDHTLVAFGGAGGQHACALAALLGITRVLVPSDCSLLSARGIGAASVERIVQEQVLLPQHHAEVGDRITAAEARARRLLKEEVKGVASPGEGQIEVDTTLSLRYRGQDSGLEVAARPLGEVGARFRKRYLEVFGSEVDREIEVEWLRTRARLSSEGLPVSGQGSPIPDPDGTADQQSSTVEVWCGREWLTVPKVERAWVPPQSEDPLVGPALITEDFSSTWLAPGWRAVTEQRGGGLLLEFAAETAEGASLA